VSDEDDRCVVDSGSTQTRTSREGVDGNEHTRVRERELDLKLKKMIVMLIVDERGLINTGHG
jgi:hypothetical protein